MNYVQWLLNRIADEKDSIEERLKRIDNLDMEIDQEEEQIKNSYTNIEKAETVIRILKEANFNG